MLKGAATSKEEFLERMEHYMIYLSDDYDYRIVRDLMKDIYKKRKSEKKRLISQEQGQQRGEIPSEHQVIKIPLSFNIISN